MGRNPPWRKDRNIVLESNPRGLGREQWTLPVVPRGWRTSCATRMTYQLCHFSVCNRMVYMDGDGLYIVQDDDLYAYLFLLFLHCKNLLFLSPSPHHRPTGQSLLLFAPYGGNVQGHWEVGISAHAPNNGPPHFVDAQLFFWSEGPLVSQYAVWRCLPTFFYSNM